MNSQDGNDSKKMKDGNGSKKMTQEEDSGIMPRR
eukprot:SAG11_NODE_4122_length_2055_cov_1.926892_2_plen_34_part_00